MKIGMPVLVELKDIYKCIEAAKEYSLDFIAPSLPQSYLSISLR